MNTGMLWYDDDPRRPLAEKVQRAVDYYAARYGVQPTTAHVHPSMIAPAPNDEPQVVAGVRLRRDKTIIKNHFWLGVETEAAP